MEEDRPPSGVDKPADGMETQRTKDEVAPEQDDADLDDLDDILSEFSVTTHKDSKPVAPDADTTGEKQPPEPDLSEAEAEEFKQQLQEQMAALLGNTQETPGMQKEMDAILQELGDAADPGPSLAEKEKGAKAAAASASGFDEPFQDRIRKTMERMQASGDQATAAAAAKPDESDDMLAKFMKELQQEMQSGGPEGPEDEEGFNKVLMGVMQQLTTKAILYEPMKDLHDGYPAWIEKNKAKTKPEDMKRYVKQSQLVKDLVERFEKSDYSDDSAADKEFVVERMQQMQAEGNPPVDLVGDMNPLGDALSDVNSNCAQQ